MLQLREAGGRSRTAKSIRSENADAREPGFAAELGQTSYAPLPDYLNALMSMYASCVRLVA